MKCKLNHINYKQKNRILKYSKSLFMEAILLFAVYLEEQKVYNGLILTKYKGMLKVKMYI